MTNRVGAAGRASVERSPKTPPPRPPAHLHAESSFLSVTIDGLFYCCAEVRGAADLMCWIPENSGTC